MTTQLQLINIIITNRTPMFSLPTTMSPWSYVNSTRASTKNAECKSHFLPDLSTWPTAYSLCFDNSIFEFENKIRTKSTLAQFPSSGSPDMSMKQAGRTKRRYQDHGELQSERFYCSLLLIWLTRLEFGTRKQKNVKWYQRCVCWAQNGSIQAAWPDNMDGHKVTSFLMSVRHNV